MVRYRPETGERGYTFRLNSSNADGNAVNGVSPTGTLMSDHSTSTLDSSIYKERIDSLFRQLHQQQNRKNRVHIQEEEDEVSNPAVDNEEPTMEHLQLHFQKVLIEQRRGGASQVSSASMPSMKNNSANTTYIHVNNQINKEVSSNGDNNQKTRASFIQARNAVQAQIEKMFQDASTNAINQQQQNNKQAAQHQQQREHQPQYPSDLNSAVTINNKAVISVRADATAKPLQSSKVHIKQNVPLPPIPKQPDSPVLKKPSSHTSSVGSGGNTTEQQQQQHQQPPPSTNTYKVDYLGSVALAGRATSLETLQFPLKDLYSKYRQSLNSNSATQSYRGSMEISPAGLRIQYYSRTTAAAASQRRSLPLQEILNPFPTIAVWAAVKFVARGDTPSVRKFAFMPLICDPENQDKQNLFHPLSTADDGEWVTCPAFHPPLFTCVMRNTSAPKSLECHAFVCDNPEDAIVIAANLYQALLRNMKNNEQQQSATTSTATPMTPTTPTPVTSKTNASSSAITPAAKIKPTPPTSNGVHHQQQQPIYSPSTSMSNWSESSVTSAPLRQQQQPVRPPRRKKSSKNSEGIGISSGAGLEKRKSIRRSHSKTRSSMGKANLRRSMRSASQRSAGRVKRSVSERQLGEMLSAEVIDGSVDNGDILSKVVIPRSKSFMTVPQPNYSFAELLEELKKQEGIKSVDDVLKMIVNKDRMSFNDLTPAYKEMLMKLALTLSKDEMFQRSKNIMRHQTSSWNSKPSSKVSGTNSGNNKLASATSNGIKTSSKSSERDSDAEHSTSSSRISSVLRATKKSFSKWGGRSASTGYSITKEADKQEPLLLKNISRLDISQEPIHRAPAVVPVTSSRHQQHHVSSGNPNNTSRDFSLKTPLPPRVVQSSNSNHVAAGLIHKTAPNKTDCMSCSDSCGYDSESCSHKCYCSLNESQSHAASDLYSSDGERCYCSLRRINKSNGAPVYRIRLDSDDTDTSQDSLSVPVKVEPVKQFQQNPNNSKSNSHKSRTNYARKSQSMTSWSALSGAESPMTAWRRNTANLNQQPSNAMRKTPSNGNISMTTFLPSNALSLRQKSLSSYLSDTSLDSDVVAMTEPAQHKSFTKHSDALRRKSRSSYLSSETELESVTTTSCNSFVRGTVPSIQQQQQQQRKHSPAESVVTYQSYDSTGSSGGRTSRNFSSENLSVVSDDRRNSNSSSSLKSQNSGRGNKFLLVSAVDPKGKIVYRGTSSAGTSHHGKQRIASKAVPEGALAAKKTTEIAAMFSNIKLNQTTDIIIDDSEATEDTASELSTDDAYSSMRFRSNQGKNKAGFTKSMENSLGYLP